MKRTLVYFFMRILICVTFGAAAVIDGWWSTFGVTTLGFIELDFYVDLVKNDALDSEDDQ